MLGKGEQRAQWRFLHNGRIGSRSPLSINQTARRNRLTFVPRHARFAKSDGAGRIVQQQREIIFTWKHNAERVGAKTAITTMERGNHRDPHHIHKVYRDKARRRTLLRPVANAPNVVRIMQCYRSNSILLCFLNPQRDSFMRGYLTKCAIPIQRNHCARIFDHFGMTIDLQMSLRE